LDRVGARLDQNFRAVLFAQIVSIQIEVEAGSNTFRADEDTFEDFEEGMLFTTSGFNANNGVFKIVSVSANHDSIVVDGPLAAGDEFGNGDEQLVAYVPDTGSMTLDIVNVTLTNPPVLPVLGDLDGLSVSNFVRTTGSFVDDGFVSGQRVSAFGFDQNQGDPDDNDGDFYRVLFVTPLTLTVLSELTPEAGDGDERLIVQGGRGRPINLFLTVRDGLEIAARLREPDVSMVGDLGQLLGDLLDDLVQGNPTDVGPVITSYLYNWIDEIEEGLRNWGEFGLGLTNALFNAQAKRDVQNEARRTLGDDTERGAEREEEVGLLDVLIAELDDPTLVNTLANGFEFSPRDKQGLLEADGVKARFEQLAALFDFILAQANTARTSNSGALH